MNKKSHARSAIIIFGIFMFVCAFAIGTAGYVSQHVCPCANNQVGLFQTMCSFFTEPIDNFLKDYYANLSTSFLFTAITVLVIDFIYTWRDAEREKESLIFDMGSDTNFLTKKAVRTLRKHRNWMTNKSWLEDGSLCECDFQGADLSGCDLHKANLRGVNLQGAELDGADLCDADLRGADLTLASLLGADLRRTDFRGADVTGAEMQGADVRGALLDDRQIDSVGSIG